MTELFETALVEKKNVLNELRSNNMTLQELRFFSIYLSKINARDQSTRVVRFPLSEFQRIMGIGADMNITHFKMTVRRILQQIVEVPNENGSGYTAFQLFKEFTVTQNDEGEWYVEIDAHDKSLPLMFDFKTKYFTYELWNALKLKSANQVRMYEILKQYEMVGKRELRISELRKLLGLAPDEYMRWERFRTRVLDSCQQSLKENTDICFTYERGKAGNGGKWITIVFHIFRNTDFTDQLTLDEFIDLHPAPQLVEDEEDLNTLAVNDVPEQDSSESGDLLSDACGNEFTAAEMAQLRAVLVTVPEDKLPIIESTSAIELRWYHYLEQKYKCMLVYDGREEIKNHYAYLLKMVKGDTSN